MVSFDEVYATLPATGWLTEDEARLLWAAAGAIVGPILEVGCYHGRSTVLLAALGRPIYAVDPFAGFDSGDPSGERTWEAFTRNLIHRGIGNVTLWRQRIEDWMMQPVGFAYLDGDHTDRGTADQIDVALCCGAKGIAVHDVNDDGGGRAVKRAALSRLGPWRERVGRLAIWELR